MEQHAESPAMERLAALIGEWSMEASFPRRPTALPSSAPIPRGGQLPPALLRLARRRPRLQDELQRRDLEALEGLARFLAAEVLAALHGRLQ